MYSENSGDTSVTMSGWVDTRRNITSPFNESNVGFSRYIFSMSSPRQEFGGPDHPHDDDCHGLVLAAQGPAPRGPSASSGLPSSR
jgi:hypothetical protein